MQKTNFSQPEDNYLFHAHKQQLPIGNQIFDAAKKNEMKSVNIGGYANKRRYKGSVIQINADAGVREPATASKDDQRKLFSPTLAKQSTKNTPHLVSLSHIRADKRGENVQTTASMNKNNDYLQKKAQYYKRTAVGAAID